MPSILVVDDNRANRDALVALLESAGQDAAGAASAAEALASARRSPPDLVISDVLMPGMDGYVLARELRADPATARIPVIFYTAYFAGQDATDLARAHGVARVLMKPSDNDAILAAVREALEQREPRPAAAAHELGGGHLRVLVGQLVRSNRTLEMMSAINALTVRASDKRQFVADACRIAVERGGFRYAAIQRGEDVVSHGEDGDEAAVIPLSGSDPKAGALILRAQEPDFFDADEMRLLRDVAGDIAFALHHLEQKSRMDYLAYHDSLTDLPNRSLFSDRLGQALSAARREKRFAGAVFIDIERFRMVNETFGRHGGDDLLRAVAARLRRAARDEDTVARVGADHFGIAVAGFDNPGDAMLGLIDQLRAAFAAPVVIEGVELRVAFKAGIAVFPTDGETTEGLSANAETALRRAKETGQAYLFYAPEMNARVAESLALEHRLRRALEDGRLALHYQPKIDVKTGDIAGLEALIRWHDPELGTVPPAKFVSLMEETGMILAAGRWALGRAVADMRRWQSMGLRVPRTSVNVSALQLRQKDFVDSVFQAIAGFGRERPLLDLEITESVLVDDIEEGTRKLQTLRRAGIEVSVDDFGTGYCSLSYLARLPVDTLKIDRSFVVRMRDAGYPRNIVAMIVSLAHTLGLKVIAEGVEDDEQVRLLRELGCDQIQGYLVGRPLPAAEIEVLLRGKVAA
jgi:diguanylate cyclase (GGDEF)-like protein